MELDQETKLPIQEFSLDELGTNPSIIMIGKRGTGKAWITKTIMDKYSEAPRTDVDEPTKSHNLIGSGLNMPQSEPKTPNVIIDYR